jgi:hypothetical protein
MVRPTQTKYIYIQGMVQPVSRNIYTNNIYIYRYRAWSDLHKQNIYRYRAWSNQSAAISTQTKYIYIDTGHGPTSQPQYIDTGHGPTSQPQYLRQQNIYRYRAWSDHLHIYRYRAWSDLHQQNIYI